MSTPHFTAACGCGAVISAPCEFSEIGRVSAGFRERGWGYDERGAVQCPACAAGERPGPAPAPEAQAELPL